MKKRCGLLIGTAWLLAGSLTGSLAQTPATPPAPAQTSDAFNFGPQVPRLEKLLPSFVDRGALLFFLARAKARLGDPTSALALLEECVNLEEGLDPSGSPSFARLRGNHRFAALAARARRQSVRVSRARIALTVAEKAFIPEGLAYDAKHQMFYLGNTYRSQIVRFALDGRVTNFVAAERDRLLPINGIRVDPGDASVWADTADEDGNSELVHFDRQGALLGRWAHADGGKHEFNDLVVRRNGDVILTDSRTQEVYRFDRESGSFSTLKLNRPTFVPTNGIALDDGDRVLFVADGLGVIRVDLETGTSEDIAPGPQNTIAGIDGLYWRGGSLVAVQNGTGVPRVATFRLSADGRRVVETTILEQQTMQVDSPTTGALVGDTFYFIENSQVGNLPTGQLADSPSLQPIRIGMVHLQPSAGGAEHGVDALGAIVGVWQSDVVDGRSAWSHCAWTSERTAVLCEQTINAPAGKRHALNVFTFDAATGEYFLYVVAQPGESSAAVPLTIEGTQWIYGGKAAAAGERRFRTINDFSSHDSYAWRTESSVDGEHWTKVTGGQSKRVSDRR